MTTIKNILRNRKGKLSLEVLKADLKDILDKGDLRSFEQLSGLSIDAFIRKNSDTFSVHKEGKVTYIKLLELHDCQTDLSYAGAVKGNASSGETLDSSDNETVYRDAVETFLESNASQTSQHEDDGSDPDDEDVPWFTVRRAQKGTRTKTIIEPENRFFAREIKRNKDVDDIPVLRLKNWLSREESDYLKFVRDPELYKQNPLQCQLDIVSMWNTPHSTNSVIVIGPSVKDDGNDSFYEKETLFCQNIFTSVPSYTYTHVPYDSDTYGVIEISSSCRQGQPSVVKQSVQTESISLSVNDIWWRIASKNITCPPTDIRIGMIYHWFLGTAEDYHQDSSVASNQRQVLQEGSVFRLSTTDDVSREFEQFCDQVEHFKKGHYILISGNVSNKIRHLAHLARIPFLAVYDFDVFSCTSGLFNAVQDSVEKLRQLQIGTWKETPPNLSEDSTYWCFLRGRLEIGSSRTDSLDGTVEDPISWLKTVKDGVVENCNQVASFVEDYTVLRILIIWPESENLIPMMRKFLERLVETISHTPKIVVCRHTEAMSRKEQSQLKTMLDDFQSTNISTCRMDLSKLCLGIASKLNCARETTSEYTLPKSATYLPDKMEKKDAMWLKEDCEVLYITNPYPQTNEEFSLKSENLKFYKGGTLNWFAWYENGDSGVDIDRDVLKKLTITIEKQFDRYKSIIITLVHAPGSGGTTLAQRLLWNFHTKIPCVHAKAGSMLKSKDFPKKIAHIYEATQLPILLLVDGEDDAIVKALCKSVKHTIILYVKRYIFNMKHVSQSKNIDNKVYLKGTVSENEAELLVAKFSDRCNDSRNRSNLKKMRDNIKRKKQTHNMYEFGMTVYQHEFKGTVSYVKGYLQLKPQGDLEPWQRCLGYLSLVYFYGQTSVPAQFFSRLYGNQSNYLMSLEDDDFGYPASEFIVYDTNDRRQKTIRICHYEVAKEILEQILTREFNDKLSDTRSERLGLRACKKLASFARQFIDYCAKKPLKDSNLCQNVRHILTKTFIYRDERDTGEKVIGRKRPQLSQLLMNIPSGKLSFTERIDILESLSSSFPTDPNFHAHVGRFYAFCGPEDEKKAETRFKKALELCKEKRKGKGDLDESTKFTLVHIYHMYGMLKQRKIMPLTGQSNTTHDNTLDQMTFFENLKHLVQTAVEACDYFTKSRELTPDTADIFTHAYISELKVRLHICDYVMRHFKSNAEENNAFNDFFESEADDDCKSFVEDSISKSEMLIMECNYDVELEPYEQAELRKQVKWFHGLFSKQNLPDMHQESDDKVSKLRTEITRLKLRHNGGSEYTGDIEQVKDSQALHEIVRLYEEIFQEIKNTGLSEQMSKKDVDLDYREWIFAIRHDLFQKTYTLDETLRHVSRWHSLVKSPMSTFYLFVIKSILGFGTDTVPGSTDYLIDAVSLNTELTRKSNLVIQPKHPREWFGVGDGVKLLHPGNRKHDSRDHNKAPGTELTTCKGTILHPNTKPYFGQIEFDKSLGMDRTPIYFFPNKSALEGARYAGRRVEFKLAFTIEHGHEAFNVQLVKRHGCSKCSANVEFTSVEMSLPCQNCKEPIYKDELNEVRDGKEFA